MKVPVGRRPIALVALAALLVAACGSSGPSTRPGSSSAVPTGSPPPVATPASSSSAPATSPPSSSPGAAGSFDPTGAEVTAEIVVMDLADPVDVANAGDGSDRLFVVEQAGRIRIVKDGSVVDDPFLDIAERIASGGERGLLGLAFHPDYPTDPRLFVDYTDLNGDTVIASYTVDPVDPDHADPATESVILRIPQPFGNHNGGAVVFGPDGMLYIAMGDGGGGGDPQGNGQRLDTLLAKILRIDINGATARAPYAVPADNPFVDQPNAKPEIWLTGLRNPWRMRFDRGTGDLWIGDVGQNAWEEIDVARAGAKGLDYGWNVMEGFHCFRSDSCDETGLTLPIAEYGRDGGCAVIGGVVVRDPRQGRLDGGYLFGDACSDNLWLIDPAGDEQKTPVLVARLGRTLSAIGEAEDGTVYATSLGRGELLRLSAVSPS